MLATNIDNNVQFTLNGSDFVIIPADDYKEFMRLKNNEEYLNMLERSREQIRNGQVVIKTMEELEAMANG